MELEALLNYPRALPAMSRTVSDLLAEMNKDDPSPKRVADLVAHDPALTTRVLRLSNSAFFRVSRQIGNAEEAVALLGMTHVRSLVMAAALGSSFKNVPGVDMVQFWRYSLRVADISRSLAGVLRQNEGNAFTAGLVHAIGDLIMHIAMPDVIGPIDMGTPPLDLRRAEVERSALGYTYAEVGAGMAEKWQFPTTIVSALRHQTAPFDGEAYDALGRCASPGLLARPRRGKSSSTTAAWRPPFPTWSASRWGWIWTACSARTPPSGRSARH